MGTFQWVARGLACAAWVAGIGALLLLPHDPVFIALGAGTWALGGVLYILVG